DRLGAQPTPGRGGGRPGRRLHRRLRQQPGGGGEGGPARDGRPGHADGPHRPREHPLRHGAGQPPAWRDRHHGPPGEPRHTPVAVRGPFPFTRAAGTVLKPGDGQSEAVTFTPDDGSDYTAVSTTVAVNVASPTASITGPAVGVPGQPLTYTFAVNDLTPGIV